VLISVGNSIGNSVGNKKIFLPTRYSVSKSVANNIFLLPTDKKLPTKDSLTKHFRW